MFTPRHTALALAVALAFPALAHANPAARPGDEAMTCAQIGQEMMPAAMAMAGAFAPMQDDLATMQGIGEAGQVRFAEAQALYGACFAAETAAAVASGGMASDPACTAAKAAFDAKEAAGAAQREADGARAVAGIADGMTGVEAMAGQIDMQRIEYLSDLAEAKGCSDQ